MNLLYTRTWHGAEAEQRANEIYRMARDVVARGGRFPFDCPYEIGLAQARGPDANETWLLAVLALRGVPQGESAQVETQQRIEAWLHQAGAEEISGGTTQAANHLKLRSELGLAYEVRDSFGTFVGEPGPEVVGKPVDQAEDPLPPVSEDSPEETLAKIAEELGVVDEIAPPPIVPPPMAPPRIAPPPTVTEAPDRPPVILSPPPAILPPAGHPGAPSQPTGSGLGITCLGAGLIGIGSTIGVAGLLIGLLIAIGTYAGETAGTSAAEFAMMLACCPLPVLTLGGILAVLGIFVVWRAKKSAAR